MLKAILCLCVIYQLSWVCWADGLIEVFQWKQMDFYNRGDNVQDKLTVGGGGTGSAGSGRGGAGGTNTGGGGGGMNQKPIRRGGIIFPDQYNLLKPQGQNGKFITSRDNPVTTNTRFNPDTADTNSSYIAYNNVPMGATHFSGRLFVTMPRRRTGIPSTLNYIDMRKDGSNPSPKLYAYPNFETNYLSENLYQPSNLICKPINLAHSALETLRNLCKNQPRSPFLTHKHFLINLIFEAQPTLEPNPNRIISVYRTSVDECQRLWFIDTGMLEYPNNRMQLQRPAIWVIDLRTDQTLRRFEIPESIVATGRGLASITIDVTARRCGQAFAYIPDLVNNQLYVYSLESNRIWAFSHNYFSFDPIAGDLSIGGQQFSWNDGIFSITLGSLQPTGERNVFFHPMASNNEFVVSSAVLQNETNSQRDNHGNDFRLLGSRGVGCQSTMHQYDARTDTIFYAEIQRNGVGCWNTKRTFGADNHGTVAMDEQRMIYPSDLTIDEDGTMWVMTNSMPIFIYSNLDPNTVNFRVWKRNVQEAVQGTICQ